MQQCFHPSAKHQVAYAWVAELFSKWGEQVHVKKFRTFCDLNWQL